MLVDFFVGVAVTLIGIQSFVSSDGSNVSASEWYAVGAIVVIFGLLSVAVGYGLWKARPWAWLLGLWAGVVYVILGVLTLGVWTSWLFILVGIGSLLFYYFNRAGLKRYLGKVRP